MGNLGEVPSTKPFKGILWSARVDENLVTPNRKPSPMFVVTVRFQTAPADHGRFLSLITRNAAQSRGLEPGCQRFDVCSGPPGEVFLYEIYDDAEAFEAHKAMPHFREFDEASADLVAGKEVAIYRLEPPAAP